MKSNKRYSIKKIKNKKVKRETWKPTFSHWTLGTPFQFFQIPEFTLLPNHKTQLIKSPCCWTHLAVTFFFYIFFTKKLQVSLWDPLTLAVTSSWLGNESEWRLERKSSGTKEIKKKEKKLKDETNGKAQRKKKKQKWRWKIGEEDRSGGVRIFWSAECNCHH